jgi:hypothetical protein
MHPVNSHFVATNEVAGETVMPKRVYGTGEPVPESGVYRVSHSAHRLPHEVTLLHGHRFPRCEKCGELVEFRLVRRAPHIKSDADFRVTLFSLPVMDDSKNAA